MAMLVPQASGRQDEVAFVHGAFLALHSCKATFAFHHKANSAGRVAVIGRHFTRQDQLHADINGGCCYQFLNAMAGVAQHQDTALGFFNGR
jgi:hypothetical protein